ncbi:MAG: YqhA family protein [Campylobacterota bacterium]
MMSKLEQLFQATIWKSRLVVILAVIFGLIGAFALFVVASVDIFSVTWFVIKTYATGAHPEMFHEDVVAAIIGAVDLYLIAVVMLLFSFGLYELFIAEIDECTSKLKSSQILEIKSLDELKDKIAKVIIMVLVVNFFQRILHTPFEGALDMLYFALSIAALSIGLYFIGKVGKKEKKLEKKSTDTTQQCES